MARRAATILALLACCRALRPATRRPQKHRFSSALGEAPTTPTGSELAPSAGGELASGAPQVITIDPVGLLLSRTVPAGLVYRDALLDFTGLMLPRPDIFEDAHQAALADAPERFGAGRCSTQDWWQSVTRATYEAVLTGGDFPYDADEVAAYEAAFPALFESLQRERLLAADLWELAPGAQRLLQALRAWRDAGGPRVYACTDGFDDRLGTLLANVLGEDVVAATFDAVVGGGGEASAFAVAAEAHGAPAAACKHVATSSDSACPYETVAVDPADYDADRDDGALSSLLDLLDVWGLPKAEGDDVVVTSRTYSVYDAEYPGFDGEGDPAEYL